MDYLLLFSWFAKFTFFRFISNTLFLYLSHACDILSPWSGFKSEINSGKLIIHLSHSLSSFYCVNLINLKYPSYYPSSFIAWKIENNVNEQFDRQTMTYLSHDGFVLSIVSLLFLSPSELKTCFTACSISLTCFAVITIIRVDSLSQRLWHLFTCVQALGAHIFFSIRLVSNGFCYFTLSN